MRILLHTCCGPCSIVPTKKLKEADHDLTAWYANPNVQPLAEWRRRFDALAEHMERERVPMLAPQPYDLTGWLREVVGKEEARCATCYRIRLEAAARVAAERGFEAFSTTLLYSRFQNHDLIRAMGEAAGRGAGVPFHYEDWRQGWSEGVAESKALGMYRQQYCGCVYSEEERYGNLKSVGGL